ncbi:MULTISPECIES: hypothetical protein [Chelatococcus]|uniref:Uncharacterized protein n=1 Tax=Chelatococcus caeni TaxID=1348468 RepID=A0A840BVS2_9HYPH|nr:MULTISPECIES: hypothetical protein [Chelatococcus]MBB4017591.1 hypothetical protein [Chelatococcus caeni]
MAEPYAILLAGLVQIAIEALKVFGIGLLGGAGFWLAARLLRTS